MKFPKSLFFAFIGLLLLALLAPLFFSGGLRVERVVFVNAPVQRVFNLVADLERHPLWHPWDIRDSMPRLVYGEIRHGVDASYFWIGGRDNHGMLKWTLVEEEPHHIEGILNLSSLGESGIDFRFRPNPQGVEVREVFHKDSGHNFLMRYLKPLYRARVAEQLEGNLARLKRAAESTADIPVARPVELPADSTASEAGKTVSE